jgi:hypothetical protein
MIAENPAPHGTGLPDNRQITRSARSEMSPGATTGSASAVTTNHRLLLPRSGERGTHGLFGDTRDDAPGAAEPFKPGVVSRRHKCRRTSPRHAADRSKIARWLPSRCAPPCDLRAERAMTNSGASGSRTSKLKSDASYWMRATMSSLFEGRLAVNATDVVHSGVSGNNGGYHTNPWSLEGLPNEDSS